MASTLISCNLGVPILITQSMATLKSELCSWLADTEASDYIRLLVGPTGIEKTFTLHYLYNALKNEAMCTLLDGQSFPSAQKKHIFMI